MFDSPLCDQIKDTDPSFHNARKLYQKIDSLPTGPDWIHEVLSVDTGLKNADGSSKVEEVQLFRRDPNECVDELMGDPTFDGHIAYSPEQVYTDFEKTKRCFGEMNTGEWWEEVQVRAWSSRGSFCRSTRHTELKLLHRASFPRVLPLHRSSSRRTRHSSLSFEETRLPGQSTFRLATSPRTSVEKFLCARLSFSATSQQKVLT